MGIADAALAARKAIGQPFRSATDRGMGRELWDRAFGTNKEEPRKVGYAERPIPGGSYGVSGVSTAVAFKRLLEAMRSRAPGGWSDDRWEQSKHFSGIAYVAIHRKCRILSQSEFQVFIKDSRSQGGKRPVRPDERAYDLVRVLEKPNPQDSFGRLMYQWGLQKDLTGTALTWMVPNKIGQPMELYPIPTAIAIPQPAVNPNYPDGFYRIQPIYPYGPFSSYPSPTSAVGAAIPAQWMLRFQYPHPFLRYEGYSPLTAMRLHMDEFEMMDRSRHYSMRKSFNPSAVLDLSEMEDAMQLRDDVIDRMQAEFENAQQGPENHGRLFVPPPGGKIEPWGANPVDMDYQAGWEQLSSFILGGFGITKPAAGMVEDSSYATLYATLKQLHLITLQPECDDLARDLTRNLAPFFGDDLIIEIRCQRIDDPDILANKLNQLISAKAITKGEVREAYEMPKWGDERDDEIAGTEKQEEQGGMLGMEGGGQEQEESNPLAAIMDETEDEIEEEENLERPVPGPMGQGSLGPRDHSGKPTKSLRHRFKSLVKRHSNGIAPKKASQETVLQPVFNVNVPQPINNISVNVPKQESPRVTVKAPIVNVNVPQQKPPTVNVTPPRVRPPTINVNVPQQKAPVVNVTTPQQKPPTVNVAAAVVNVPKQPAPIVEVNVPEQKPPQVDVHVPPPRLTEKTITYDQNGRPVTTIEREIKE